MSATPLQTRSRIAAGIAVSIIALTVTGCVVWESDYDKVVAENQRVTAENQQLKAQLAQSQAEQTFVEAGDLLFPPGGYLLSPAGQTELSNNIVPRLKGYQNVKIVVYGYTDNAPVGPQLQQQGVPDNLVLSTRRASSVVSYLVAQGINPNIISAKGFGETHPAATNATPQGRAANRRIEITVQGPGAATAAK
jgi:chemotaxis protein MotB